MSATFLCRSWVSNSTGRAIVARVHDDQLRGPLIRSLLLLCAIVVAGLAASPAHADVFFKTPSGNIVCQTSRGALQCSVLSDRRGAKLPVYFLRRDGRPFKRELTGNPAIQVPVLRYGRSKTVLNGAVRCISRDRGLKCRNRDGHGYFLSRGHQRPF